VFVVSAVAAASASAALPEWGTCEAATRTETWEGNYKVGVTWKGKYEDAACTNPNQPEGKPLTGQAQKEKGQYEWYTGLKFARVHKHETGIFSEHPLNYEMVVSLGETTFETTTAGKGITCSGGYGEMEIGAQTDEVHDALLVFEGCKEAQGAKAECSSQEFFNGTINDKYAYEEEKGFKGKLGFVAGKGGASPTVGLYLTGFEKEEKLFVVVCSHGPLGTVWIGGTNKKGNNSVISLISPVDEMVGEGLPTTAFTQAFSESAPGVQAPSKFETGGVLGLQEEVNSGGFEPSAWSSTFADAPERQTEIKAKP
jgi:hypothetical protein